MLQAVLLKVLELAGNETDHIPPVMVSPLPNFGIDIREKMKKHDILGI